MINFLGKIEAVDVYFERRKMREYVGRLMMILICIIKIQYLWVRIYL